MTQLQTTWGWLVALDLFLGGLAAGVSLTIALLVLATGERFKTTVRFGYWASAIAVALGAAALLFDVGVPLRAAVLFKSFVHFDSWMAIGAWIMFGAIAVWGLAALFWTDPIVERLGRLWKPLAGRRRFFRTILAIAGIPFSLGVATYTGMLLSVLSFRPLWHTEFLPVLFISSALCTGVGLVAGYAALREQGTGARRLAIVLWGCFTLLLAAAAGALFLYLRDRTGASAEAASLVQILTSGALKEVFWGVVVALGLAVPLLGSVLQLTGLARRQRVAAVAVPIVAVVGSLVGSLTLRFLILSAGLPQNLASPAWQHILQGIHFFP